MRPAVASVFVLVLLASRAAAQDSPDPAEPPPSPDDPAPGPADGAAAAEVGAAHGDEGEDLGWEPDQRGFTGQDGGSDSPPEPEPDEESGGGVQLASESDAASRGPMLWLDGSIGGQYTDLTGLSDRDLLPQGAPGAAAGVAFSIGGGMQLGQSYVGARGVIALHAPFDLSAMELEAGVRAPLPLFDGGSTLSVRFGVGWAWLNQSDYADSHMLTEMPVGGPILEVGASLETWVSDDVTLGVAGDGMLLLPSRAPSTCDDPGPEGECVVDGFDFASDGSAVGIGTRLRLVLGLHF
jgi:hypothetical protein